MGMGNEPAHERRFPKSAIGRGSSLIDTLDIELTV